MFMIFRSKEAG